MRTRLPLLVFAPLTTQRALLYLLGAALGLAAAPAARAQLASPFQECLQDPEKPGNVVKLSFHPGMERVGYELWCGKFTASGTAQFTIPGKFIEDSRGIPLYYSFTSFLEFDETSGDLVGGTVRLDSLSNGYWQQRYLAARRVLGDARLAHNP